MLPLATQGSSLQQFFSHLNHQFGGIPLPIEVLEQVLIHVPFKDIHCQLCVCKLWARASIKSLHQHATSKGVLNDYSGGQYVRQFRAHKHSIRSIDWDKGLLSLLRFLELVPDVQLDEAQSPLNEHPFAFLNIGSHQHMHRPELDDINLVSLTPSSFTHQMCSLKLDGLRSFFFPRTQDTTFLTPKQQMTSLLCLFPRLDQLSLLSPLRSQSFGTDTESITVEALWAIKDELCSQRNHLPRWQLLDLTMHVSLLAIMDERWFFEKSWYLKRLRLQLDVNATYFIRLPNSPMGFEYLKSLAYLLMECCPNLEEVRIEATESRMAEYHWILPVGEPRPQCKNTDAPSGQTLDDWVPLHGSPQLNIVQYRNAWGDLVDYHLVHPRLKRLAAANTLSSIDLRILAQFQHLTELVIVRGSSTCPIQLGPRTLQFVLQSIATLEIVRVTGYHLSPLLMAPCTSTTSTETEGSRRPAMPLAHIDPPSLVNSPTAETQDRWLGDEHALNKPWACQRLRVLQARIRCETVSPEEHRLAFTQLGKLKQLEVLDLSKSSLLLAKSHGIEAMAGLDKLQRFGYLNCAFTPSKDGFQWMLRRSEAQWIALERIHLNVTDLSSYAQEMLTGWALEVDDGSGNGVNMHELVTNAKIEYND
ncbi:hypothetical protein DFQ27_005680 [Actinomortierella ambigua]|uniref:F-box domain-containing protein n=1 Tax=Actinomortierella ambigua TaxID=1343610 RepID=A0A9P6Q020_9FUNG|nr:hypothetical protein DFQ27_005680 [Actinomortierella ambigua]